jgi:1-acyl-sn-glycerol-3-phosphate acyltransferase
MLYAILKVPAVALMRWWFRLRVTGAEHVPPTGAALIVSNHQSILDPPVVGGSAPRQIFFLAKAELFRIPLFGRLIHALHARPVGATARIRAPSRRPRASSRRERPYLFSLRAPGASTVALARPSRAWGCSR